MKKTYSRILQIIIALLIILMIGNFISKIEFQRVSKNFTLGTYIEGGEHNIKILQSLWYEQYPKELLGLKFSPLVISVEVLIENIGENPYEINASLFRIFNDEGKKIGTNWADISGRSFPYQIIWPGETKSLWVSEIVYPDQIKNDEKIRGYVSIEAIPARDVVSCHANHYYSYEIDHAGYIEDKSQYTISGRVDAPIEVDIIPHTKIYFTFYDFDGNFIGRRVIFVKNEDGSFVDSFDPNEPPWIIGIMPHYEGGYILGEIDSYEVHFIEEVIEFCP